MMRAARAQNCHVKRANVIAEGFADKLSALRRGCSRTTLKRLPIPVMLVGKMGKKLLRSSANWCETVLSTAKNFGFLAVVLHPISTRLAVEKSGKKLL